MCIVSHKKLGVVKPNISCFIITHRPQVYDTIPHFPLQPSRGSPVPYRTRVPGCVPFLQAVPTPEQPHFLHRYPTVPRLIFYPNIFQYLRINRKTFIQLGHFLLRGSMTSIIFRLVRIPSVPKYLPIFITLYVPCILIFFTLP